MTKWALGNFAVHLCDFLYSDPTALLHGGSFRTPSHRLLTHTLRHLPSFIHLQTQKASRLRPRRLPASSPASSPLGLTSPSPPHQT